MDLGMGKNSYDKKEFLAKIIQARVKSSPKRTRIKCERIDDIDGEGADRAALPVVAALSWSDNSKCSVPRKAHTCRRCSSWDLNESNLQAPPSLIFFRSMVVDLTAIWHFPFKGVAW